MTWSLRKGAIARGENRPDLGLKIEFCIIGRVHSVFTSAEGISI